MKFLYLTSIFLFCVFSVTFSQVRINELCASNGDVLYDKEYYNFSGWIEVFNSSPEAVNLGGYFLSENSSALNKWRFPDGTIIAPNEYLIVWCDEMGSGLHTNFTLRSKGGNVFLSSGSGVIIDSTSFPAQPTNVSFGRSDLREGKWTFQSVPSPGRPNIADADGAQLSAPAASITSGRYGSPISVSLVAESKASTIHYTINGSEPSSNSPEYKRPIQVTKTTTIKARSYAAGGLPSETSVFTYFINEHLFTIPVISLSTSPDYLWDDEIGIYTDGKNGVVGPCFLTPVNFYQDWDRHADFEYFAIDGKRLFTQSGDLRISGGCSRTFRQKSFALKARNKYGDNEFRYPFFPNKFQAKYGGFFIRNSGNDQSLTMFRDALLQSLIVGQMDIDYQAYQPTALYLNGVYWGIQNLREKVDADYIKTNYGIEEDDIDLLEFNGVAIEGTANAYLSYLEGLKRINVEDSASFDYIAANIDVDEYINYMVTEIYYANTDWPGNNMKFWRQRSNGGKFRWILLDLDFGFDLNKSKPSGALHPTLEFATDPDQTEWPNPAWSTLHFRQLLKNPVFRSKFIERMNAAINVTFQPQRVNKFIDSLQNTIQHEIRYHKARWGHSMEEWDKDVQLLRDFAVARNAFMKKHVAEFFNLPGQEVEFSVRLKPLKHGSFVWNGVRSSEAINEQKYPRGLGYTIEAVPDYQEQFKYWKVTEWDSKSEELIRKKQAWQYFDQGRQPEQGWTSLDFTAQDWQVGLAELGYGDGDENTVIDYGSDENKKHTTTYFRHVFYAANVDDFDYLKASILYDDGVIVYLNGQEIFRENLPVGKTDFNTYASRIKYAEEAFYNFRIDPGYLVAGENVLAVEVHQISDVSSDLSFDMELLGVQLFGQTLEHIDEPLIRRTMDKNILLEAVFEISTVKSRVVINEFSATKNKTVVDEYGEREDWIELYNPSTTAFDLDGFFITDKLLTKQKHQLRDADGALVIEPGGYLVLWADEDQKQGPSHLNFKLSSEGEAIGLYQLVNGELITHDEVIFEYLNDNYSLARIPNGSGEFVNTKKMTPNAPNVFINGDVEVLIYPNPIESYLHIESKHEIQMVAIYDFSGNVVKQFVAVDSEPINVYYLKPGLYVINILIDGEVLKYKLIKE